MKAKLTDLFLQKQKLTDGQRIEVFDQQVPGFGIRIGGREKAFFFIRRVQGRKVRMSLGVYPAVSLSKARSLALDILHRINAGEDPTEKLKRRKLKANDLEDLRFSAVADRFLAQYCRGKKKPLRERTVVEYERYLTGPLVAGWNGKAIDQVIDRDVIAVIDRLEGEGHFASARLFKAYTRKFFGWCVEKRLLDKNPAEKTPLGSRPSDFVRERVLSVPEIRLILGAADRLDAPYRAFVYVLALCGQRRHETSVMKWHDLDLDSDKPIWRIPGEVTKNHRTHDVPLAPCVVNILRQVPRIITSYITPSSQQVKMASEYVFSGDGKAPVSGFSKIKDKLDRIVETHRAEYCQTHSSLAHWTWHDLRRSTATGMADRDIAPHVIEAVLNHVSGSKAGVAGIYNRGRYDEARTQALTKWSDAVLISGEDSNIRRTSSFEVADR